MKDKRFLSVIYAVAAAVFYAIGTPFSKLLLAYVPSTFMASFLYFGAGLGIGCIYIFRFKKEPRTDRLEKKDLPYTVGMIVLDIAAPIFLMLGIKLGTASEAALLGNFEIAATAVIALLLFKEKVSAKLWITIGLITVSGILLSLDGTSGFSISAGSLFVLLATVCWGLENNCTRSISDKSTYQIVILKGFGSGFGSFCIACAIGEKLPAPRYVLAAMVLGFVAYGLSVFTYVRAQRHIGAAKTGAFYAIAPFVGSILALVILDEPLTNRFGIAFLIMMVGTAFAVADTIGQANRQN